MRNRQDLLNHIAMEGLSLGNINNWIISGKRLGYPECCTREFIEKSLQHGSTKDSPHFKGTGFIPCSNHSDTGYRDMVDLMAANGRKTPFLLTNEYGLDCIVDPDPTNAEWAYIDNFVRSLYKA